MLNFQRSDLRVCVANRSQLGCEFFASIQLRLDLGGMVQGYFDLFGHQTIGAYFAIVEGVSFIEPDVKNSGYDAVVVNGQD